MHSLFGTAHSPLLHRTDFGLAGSGASTDYARLLLESLGARVHHEEGARDLHPAIAWARSGVMMLTGEPDGPPLMCPAPLASCAEGVLSAIGTVCGTGTVPVSGAPLLGERAAIAGLRRGGATSPGGSCRLLRCVDGWVAVNLPRLQDWELLPAWLESGSLVGWAALAAAVSDRSADSLVERARLLGLAASAARESPRIRAPWYSAVRLAGARGPRRRQAPLVVDLSSLWAGPLCSHLLQAMGARVVKVESVQRPDGARGGPSAFFDLLNWGKRSVALDFRDASDIDRLRRLIAGADIVIESSRPRALRQLGIDARTCIASAPGLTWISITGYGRGEPEAGWIAYGDDAGVAAGLTGLLLGSTGKPLFCGDAIADPLTGMHAALAAWSGYASGGGCLISLALHDVARHCIAFSLPDSEEEVRERWSRWQGIAEAAGLSRARPLARLPRGPSRPLGADTTEVLGELC